MKWYFKLEWVLHNVTTVFPIMVTIVFWTFVFQPKPGKATEYLRLIVGTYLTPICYYEYMPMSKTSHKCTDPLCF